MLMRMIGSYSSRYATDTILNHKIDLIYLFINLYKSQSELSEEGEGKNRKTVCQIFKLNLFLISIHWNLN